MELTPTLAKLKQQFIVPNSALVDLIKLRRRLSIFDYYYCPYAPCCSGCKGVFTFREVLGHLRRTHDHSAKQIRRLVDKGLPKVPDRS